MAVVSPEVVPWITGPSYGPSLHALAFCLVAVLGAAMYLVASLPSAIQKATGDLGLASGTGVVACVLANVVLVGVWGSVGTALALAIGQLVAVGIVARRGRRRLALPFDWTRLVALFVLTTLVVLGSLVLAVALPIRLVLGVASVLLILRLVPVRRAALAAAAARLRDPGGRSVP
jgi:O-antigen/teichoic acid export membrane protein